MPFANARPKSKHQAVKMNFYCEKLAHWMHPIEQYSTSSTKQCEQSHTAARCVHTNTPGPRFCMVCTTDKVSNMLRRYAKTTSRNEGWTTFANGWSCTVLHTRLILHNIIVNWLTWALGRKEPFGCGEYQVVFRVLCGGDAITDEGNNRTNQHQPGALIRTTVMKLMVWLWNVTILLLYIRSATAQWVLCVWERERENKSETTSEMVTWAMILMPKQIWTFFFFLYYCTTFDRPLRRCEKNGDWVYMLYKRYISPRTTRTHSTERGE